MSTQGDRRILDIGCGSRKTPGAIGLDALKDSAADIVADLAGAWPIPDGSFDDVVANHVLEHVPDVVHVMEEAWRVLRPGGRMTIRGPHFSSPDLVWSDPTHRRGLSISMFLHFGPGTVHPYSRGRFKLERAYLSTALSKLGPTARAAHRVSRPIFLAYERFVNRDLTEQRRAERYWSRVLPFDEVTVELARVEA